jgi:hypothetical protein
MLIARLGLTAFALSALVLGADTRNIILVTADGLRWQDAFHGMDPLLAKEKSAHMDEADVRRKRWWRETELERREALMPFFWKQLAPKGVVLGNVKVTNAYRVSYPGYSEILTGRTEDSLIRNNDPIRNPNQTVLEFLRRKLGLRKEQVALFASWDVFQKIGEHEEGSISINAGYQAFDNPSASPSIAELSRIQFRMLTPWDEARHDYITGAMGLEYLKHTKPRALYISFDETDDWAHANRYDRVLDAISEFDQFLERLWNTVQSMKEYRNRTTLVVTSDHGRGSTLEDWNGHGSKVVGADRIWMAIVGPGTPAAGESSATAEQRDIAPTIIKLMGFDPAEYTGATGSPIGAAISSRPSPYK